MPKAAATEVTSDPLVAGAILKRAKESFSSLDTTLGRMLAQRLAGQIAEVAWNLAYGSAMMKDPALTAQKYSEELGYVRALTESLDFCRQIEDELLGRGRDKSGVPS